MFQHTDNAYAKMQKLVRVRQNRDISITDLIIKVRPLEMAAHRSVTYEKTENFFIFHFILRL